MPADVVAVLGGAGMGHVILEIGQTLGKKTRLHKEQAAVAYLGEGSWIEHQDALHCIQRFVILLLLVVDALQLKSMRVTMPFLLIA